MMQMPEIIALGDRALVVRIGHAMNPETFRAVQALAKIFVEHLPRGTAECVPAIASIAIYYDPEAVSYAELSAAIRQLCNTNQVDEVRQARRIEIPVCYGGEFGEDLEAVARHHRLTTDEVIAIHSGAEYLVYMLGFVPGFPYLGGMLPRIASPRRPTPRLQIPAGSVGIAGEQTGIYPFATPGGWQLIGRTPIQLFASERSPPSFLEPGDRVQFVPIKPEDFRRQCEGIR